SLVASKFDYHMQLNQGASPEAAAQQVIRAMNKAGEFEMYGSYAWAKDTRQAPLSDYVGHVEDYVNESVDEVINAKLAAQGMGGVDDYTIFRAADANGEPIIQAHVIGPDNSTTIVVRGSEIKAAYDRRLKKKRQPASPDVAPTYTRPGTS